MMALQFSAAFAGTVAFALLFGVPRRFYPYCGLIGGTGWLFCCLASSALTAAESTFFAAVLVMFLSRLCAVRKKCPVTIFLISGIIPLVPGAGIYWAAFYMVTGQFAESFQAGFAAVRAAAAIVLGIVCVYELPQKIFRIGMGSRTNA